MYDYIITLKEKKKPELIISIGRGEQTVIKVSGKLARHLFEKITDNPRMWEYLEPIDVKTKEKKYSLRADIAPIIVCYILLNRRSPKPEKWDWFLDEVFDGKLSMIGKDLSSIVELFFTLTNVVGYKKATEAVSSMLKAFAGKVRLD